MIPQVPNNTTSLLITERTHPLPIITNNNRFSNSLTTLKPSRTTILISFGPTIINLEGLIPFRGTIPSNITLYNKLALSSRLNKGNLVWIEVVLSYVASSIGWDFHKINLSSQLPLVLPSRVARTTSRKGKSDSSMVRLRGKVETLELVVTDFLSCDTWKSGWTYANSGSFNL